MIQKGDEIQLCDYDVDVIKLEGDVHLVQYDKVEIISNDTEEDENIHDGSDFSVESTSSTTSIQTATIEYSNIVT